MARVNPKRKKEIREYADKWLGILEQQKPRDYYKNLPFKTSLKMLKEMTGE